MENDFVKFDFNDVLITPKKKTNINSRYKEVELPQYLPLFTAPMDTVVNLNNVNEFLNNKINITLPRTIKYNDYLNHIYNRPKHRDYLNVFVSFGLDEITEHYKNNFEFIHKKANILIDVANGHMQKIVDICKEIKRLRPDITIMVGNIGNPETYKHYVENQCVDYIRCGIGAGGGCLTTQNSRVGYPMASLIKETREIKNTYLSDPNNKLKLPAIVADGGMKDYSDIIMSLALGADYVMVGSIFNKSLESCADNYLYGFKLKNKKLINYLYKKKFPIKKYFRGMSTKQAQKAMGKTNLKTSEGVVRFRKVEYRLKGWVENFEHYLRNAMSYSNAKTLEEFIGKANIIKISKNSYDRFNK